MKNIRIFIPDACFGFWLEVRKFLSPKGFVNHEGALPQSTLGISESNPVDTGKFHSTRILPDFHVCTAAPGFMNQGIRVIIKFPCQYQDAANNPLMKH